MKATITAVEVQTGNQLNVSVQYTDDRTGFDRTNVFTIHASEIKRFYDPEELEKLIQQQGKEYKDIAEKKDEFDGLVGTEFEIK